MTKARVEIALVVGMLIGMIVLHHMQVLAHAEKIRWVQVAYPAKLVFVGTSMVAYYAIKLITANLKVNSNWLYLLQEKIEISDLIFGLFLVNFWLYRLDLWSPVCTIVFE